MNNNKLELINNNSNLYLNYTKPVNRLMDKYEIKLIFGVIMGALCIITTLGNILVIIKYRKASMVGNLFIISLAVADLIVGSFVMPLATVYTITEVWSLTLPVCQIWLSADYTASTASILNLFTLSLDRYWSITSPLEYLGKRTKSRALIMISIAWSLSLLWLVPIVGWAHLFNNGIRYVPEDKCKTEYDKNIIFKLTTAVFNFYLPLLAMIGINTKIYLVIHKRYKSPIMKYTSVIPNKSQLNNNNNNSNNNNKTRGISFSITSSNGGDVIYELNSNKTNKPNNLISKFFLKKKDNFNINTSIISLNNNTTNNNTNNINNNNNNNCRSLLNKIAENRRIPDDSVKMSKLVYRETINPITPDNNNLNGRNSPLFLKYCQNQIQEETEDDSNTNDKNKISTIKNDKSKLNVQEQNRFNRKGFMNKQEKAFKQLSAIVIGFTLCFLPYFIVFLIVAICENCVSDEVFSVTLWLGYFNSTMNPFLYALSNKTLNKNKKPVNKSVNNTNYYYVNSTTHNKSFRFSQTNSNQNSQKFKTKRRSKSVW